MRRSTLLYAVLSLGLTSACAKSQPEHAAVPAIALTGRVTDEAAILSPDVEARLDRTLAAYERRSRHQLVVVTARSLQGRGIGAFTRDLGNAWGIGRKGIDDGVIVLLAPVEKKARIAVGKGLETTLTNERAAKVLQDVMVPQFKAKRYDQGVERGVTAIIKQLDERERPTG